MFLSRISINPRKYLSNDVAKAVTALFGANLFTAGVGVLGALIQGIFVPADELGFFKQFGIISSYLFFLHLGTFHAIERLYPYYKGKGEEQKAKEIVEHGNSWIISVCFLITLVFAIFSVACFIKNDWKSGLCWIVQIITTWVSLYGGFLAATYRSGKEFQRMAKANIYNPIFSLLTIPLYWVQPFWAMALRNSTGIATTIRLHQKRPVRVKFRFNGKGLLRLITEGLPLFSASYITTTGLDAIRGSIIVAVLGLTDFGLWSFSYQVLTIALMLPTAITAVYVPRVIEKYASTDSIRESLNIAKIPIKTGLLLSLLIVPLSVVLIYYLLPIILPNYKSATMLIIALVFALPLKLTDIFSSVLIAAKKKVTLNTIAILGAITQISLAVLGVYLGFGIISFAVSYLAGYVVRAGCYLLSIRRMINNSVS